MLTAFFLYLFAHCLADTSLQTEFMAKGKNRNIPVDMSRVPPGQKPLNLWYMWLTHHAFIQAGGVFFVTYFLIRDLRISLVFGTIELFHHWITDFMKCENMTDPVEDQLNHIALKVLFSVGVYVWILRNPI